MWCYTVLIFSGRIFNDTMNHVQNKGDFSLLPCCCSEYSCVVSLMHRGRGSICKRNYLQTSDIFICWFTSFHFFFLKQMKSVDFQLLSFKYDTPESPIFMTTDLTLAHFILNVWDPYCNIWSCITVLSWLLSLQSQLSLPQVAMATPGRKETSLMVVTLWGNTSGQSRN